MTFGQYMLAGVLGFGALLLLFHALATVLYGLAGLILLGALVGYATSNR